MSVLTSSALKRLMMGAVLAATATSAQAVITITNGDFATRATGVGANADLPGVEGWFNAQNPTAPWYFNVSQARAVSPTATVGLVLTGNHDAAGGVPIPWVYQSIGTNSTGLSTLKLQFDLGGFTDNNPISTRIDISLYKGTGFVGADNTDIAGASGVTLLGTQFVERLNFAGGSGVVNYPLDFDLSGATASDELFIRFQSSVPAGSTQSNYTYVDNIKIRPEIIYVPVDLTWSGLAAGGTWDLNNTAHFNAGTAKFQEGDRPTFGNAGAVDGNNVSIVNVGAGVISGNVIVDSTHDYTFQGGGAAGVATTTTFVKRGTNKLTIKDTSLTFNGGFTFEGGTVEVTTAFAGGGAEQRPFGDAPIANNASLVLNHTYTFTGTNEYVPVFIEGVISGTGSLTIRNDAFLGQAGSTARENTYTGTTSIESGAFVYLADVRGLGSPTAGTTVQAGSTLATMDAFHLGANPIIDEPLTLNGYGTPVVYSSNNPAGALFIFTGTRTFSGPIHLGSTTMIYTNALVDATTGAETPSTLILTGALTAAAGAGLEKQGNGNLSMTGGVLESLTVYGGKVTQTAGTTKVKTLFLEAGTTLDLTTSGFALDYTGTSEYETLRAMMVSGQIFATLPTGYGLGIVENATLLKTTFGVGNVPVDSTTVMLRGTRLGDSDLSGKVDFDDLLALARNYSATGSGKLWQNGDTDYNGIVNFDDLLALARNYNQLSLAPGEATLLDPAFLADFALAQSLVPEPTTLSALGLGALVLRRRRATQA